MYLYLLLSLPCIKAYIFLMGKSHANFRLCFSIAHTVHEGVSEQASIMVNGKLKEYQIKVGVCII